MNPVPTPEKGTSSIESSPEKQSAVIQPLKSPNLAELLGSINMSDLIGDTASENWSDGGSTSQAMTQTGTVQGEQSARAQAIANIPDAPEMRKELSNYIQKEIKTLRKEVRRATFRMYKPGSAHSLNELYSKMRRLNSLLSELMEASVDVLKRLFIRIFIDKQKVL